MVLNSMPLKPFIACV